MLRKESEAVPEGNGPVPQKEKNGSGQPTWGDVYRVMKEALDRWDKKLDEILDETRVMDQHITSLEHGARQPRLAMRRTDPQALRLASARRAPLQQYKRFVGIAFLLAGLNLTQTPARPVSA